MDTRIDRALDGELSRDELSGDEVFELMQEEALIQRVLSSIPVQPVPDLSQAVLLRIGAEAPAAGIAKLAQRSSASSLLRWLWAPRPVALRFRPAYAFAAMLLIFALVLRDNSPRGEGAVAAEGAAPVLIQFRLDAPQAERVSLAGDFTDWQPEYELRQSHGGVWTIIVPLRPGMHEYAFIVDGERWISDPHAPAVGDGFGGVNSRMAVIAPDTETL